MIESAGSAWNLFVIRHSDCFWFMLKEWDIENLFVDDGDLDKISLILSLTWAWSILMSLFSKSSEIENLFVDSHICFQLNDLSTSMRYERFKITKDLQWKIYHIPKPNLSNWFEFVYHLSFVIYDDLLIVIAM